MTGALRRCAATAAAALAAVAGLPSSAAGAGPSIERISIHRTSTQGFLSESCGFTVTQILDGHLTAVSFGDSEGGLVELRIASLRLSYTANGNTYQVQEVGPLQIRVLPDGTTRTTRTTRAGQVALGWIGIERVEARDGISVIVLNTGRGQAYRVDEICEALAE
jgi:hypothetical protein